MNKLFAVGGFVRDYVLRIKTKDLDVLFLPATSNPWQEMIQTLQSIGASIKLVNPEYGRALALVPSAQLGAFAHAWQYLNGSCPQYIPYDFLLPRRDKNCLGRHAEIELTTSLEEDLSRRDFTVNALAMQTDGEIIDLFGGLQHCRNRQLHFIGNSSHRVAEDYLRLLRAIRFHITKHFSLPPDFYSLITPEVAYHIKHQVSADRRDEELYKCFAYDTPKTVKILSSLPDYFTNAILDGIWLQPTMRKP